MQASRDLAVCVLDEARERQQQHAVMLVKINQITGEKERMFGALLPPAFNAQHGANFSL